MASLTPDVLERATAAARKAAEAAPASGRVDRPVLPKPVQNCPSIQGGYKLRRLKRHSRRAAIQSRVSLIRTVDDQEIQRPGNIHVTK
jgi:hypothetical protein